MIEHKELLKAAAQQIDDLDGQIAALNAQKSDIYSHVKESVGATDYKAWRAAVKLRQKRRLNRADMEEHEALVAEMLFFLESPSIKGGQVSSPAPIPASANGIVEGLTCAGARDTEINEVAA